jgi:hypothetical protein
MNNITTVKNIGRGVRLTETAVTEIIASLSETFDHKERGAVAEAVHVWACGDGERPAVKTGKKGAQVTTDYGTGHDTLVRAVKRALSVGGDKPVALRATLSGEGGGSVTINRDDNPDLYDALVAMITGDADEIADAA